MLRLLRADEESGFRWDVDGGGVGAGVGAAKVRIVSTGAFLRNAAIDLYVANVPGRLAAHRRRTRPKGRG